MQNVKRVVFPWGTNKGTISFEVTFKTINPLDLIATKKFLHINVFTCNETHKATRLPIVEPNSTLLSTSCNLVRMS